MHFSVYIILSSFEKDNSSIAITSLLNIMANQNVRVPWIDFMIAVTFFVSLSPQKGRRVLCSYVVHIYSYNSVALRKKEM